MAYQLPAVASRSDTDLASLWFDLDAADALPSPVSASTPGHKSPQRIRTLTAPNGDLPADSSGFRPALPTKTSNGPNSPHRASPTAGALPTASSSSPASQPSNLAPAQRSNVYNQDSNTPKGQQDPAVNTTKPPPRLQTDLSSLQLLPPLPNLTTPISPTSPALGSPSYRLARSTSRHTPSNSHSSFFQDPANVTSVSPPRSPLAPPPAHAGLASGATLSVPGRPTKFVPTISDAAKLDRSRTLVRNLMGTSTPTRRAFDPSSRDDSPRGENEARGSARGAGGHTPSSSHLGQHDHPQQQQLRPTLGYDGPRSRTVSHQDRTGDPSSPAQGRQEQTPTSPEQTSSRLPPRPSVGTVPSFSSFAGQDGQPRRVLIDGRLFEFDAQGTTLKLVDQAPPPPTTSVVSPPSSAHALPRVLTNGNDSGPAPPTSSLSSPPNAARATPPTLSTLNITPTGLLDPATNGRASQQFYGDLLGDFSASPTVESLREAASGSRFVEGSSPKTIGPSESDRWGQQPAEKVAPAEQASQERVDHSEVAAQGAESGQPQPQPSKRSGFIAPKQGEGEPEKKKVVSSSEQLRKLEAKYGIEPRGHASRPSASSSPMSSPPVSSQGGRDHPSSNVPAAQVRPLQSPPLQLPVRHQTSPPLSTAQGGDSSALTQPVFPPTLESKLSSSSIRSQQPLPFQSASPIAHPHQPPFQHTEPSSPHPLPPPPVEPKSPPSQTAAISPQPSPPRRVTAPATASFQSSDDDNSEDDDAPLAFAARSRAPPPPPKEHPAPSPSQQQPPRRPERAEAEDWVLPSPIDASSSSRPTDPYEVLSRPMPRELDLGNKFGEKLKKNVSVWRREAGKIGKKATTQVQALRPVGPTSPTNAPQPLHPSARTASQNIALAHQRSNSTDPNAHHQTSPTELPPRPPSPMREAADPMSYTAREVAQRAEMIEDEEERKLAEAMFM